ncbi:DUF1801 domain-containing protein [Herbiconiux moechotypicola]|uniref:YdhG-like domain-containing protein n=1 Tax=Herbiconiux moechotypicola TaxID=637393 RepID=A0ABP5QIQ5_9MICO|nr:DUF1801 domain-containing protein [Herbiconiux moechotypicola]MCS5730061.1 DUF1801 domain-containing protein [Herbiconiux moechotypicola]
MTATPSRSPEVDALLAERAHPLAESIDVLRRELLALPGVVENVKWNSPNYALADDFATLQLRRPTAVQLVLHTGAAAKPDHPEIVVDPLPAGAKWAGRNRLVVTLTSSPLPADDLATLRTTLAAWVAQLH